MGQNGEFSLDLGKYALFHSNHPNKVFLSNNDDDSAVVDFTHDNAKHFVKTRETFREDQQNILSNESVFNGWNKVNW